MNPSPDNEKSKPGASPTQRFSWPTSAELRLFLKNLRQRLILSSVGDPSAPKGKKNRPRWLLRLACTIADLGTVSIICSLAMSVVLGGLPDDRITGVALAILAPSYYLFWEWLIGRTPAKMVLGIKMTSVSGDLTRGRLVWRGLVRFLPLIQFFLMLSWSRVTLLDLLSGTRVQCLPPVDKPSRSAPPPPSKSKGYDENLSQR